MQTKIVDKILVLLEALPKTVLAGHKEVLYFIELHRLMGKGLRNSTNP
jgi:hypothetical protein